jgi:hypothetical protein
VEERALLVAGVQREKGERERRGFSPEREGEMHLDAAGEEIVGEEGWSPARGGGGDRQRQRTEAEQRRNCQAYRGRTEKELPGLGRERGKVFFKTGYGRTGQSIVPVRCTPDSAQKNGF